MLVNADLSRAAIVTPDDHRWVSFPQPGVERVMLDRLGGESGRATSIVRYAPGSIFPHHPHPGGEEILVLSGTFTDGDTDYRAGWYLRNPPGSAHRPSSTEGAVIFVKLRQMPPTEQRYVRIDTRDPASWQPQGGRDVCPLFSDSSEEVRLLRLAPGEALRSSAVGGAEWLVLDGQLESGDGLHESGTWARFPSGADPQIVAGAPGATVYLKTGHLPHMGTGT